MPTRRSILASSTSIGACSVAGCLGSLPSLSSDEVALEVTTEWPRVEYDAAATGQQPGVTGPTDEPAIQWDVEVPVDDGSVPATLVVDGTIVVAGGSTVTALEADGSQVWQTELFDAELAAGGRGYYCSAAAGDNHVFVGTHHGLFALEQGGDVEWSHEVDPDPGSSGVFRSPAVVDETIYFCTAEEREVCAYTTDGDERWRVSLEEPISGGPAVHDDRVFVGDDAGLHAFSTDGDADWSVDIGRVRATPTTTDQAVYAAGMTDSGHTLAEFSSETGDERWHSSAPSISGSPTVVDTDATAELAVPSWLGTVFLYDRQDGTPNWGAPIGDNATGRPVFPVADERRVYTTYRGHLACIEPRSDRLWDLEVDGGNGTIAIVDDALLVATTGGRCYAVA